MSDVPAMPLFCEPLLADTDHLTDCELGLYTRMLAKLWLAPNRRFPNDDEWLARKFRRTPDQVRSEMRPIIQEFFKSDGNCIYHKRIDKEYEHIMKTQSARSASAKARWDKEKRECKRNAPTPTPTLTNKKDSVASPEGEAPPNVRHLFPEQPGPQLSGHAPKTADDQGKAETQRGSRLPNDWRPTGEMIEFGAAKGYAPAQVETIAEKFADYWRQQPGAKGRKSDWPATWRNWIRAEAERYPPLGGNGRYRSSAAGSRSGYDPEIPF